MTLELDDRQRAMLQEMGVHVWLPGTAFAPEAPVSVVSAPAQPPSPPPTAAVRPVRTTALEPSAAVMAKVATTEDVKSLDWQALQQTMSGCQACALGAGRKNTTLRVPAAGQAHWLVLGDPPDEDEDRLGQPFVEQTGLLLDNMLKAMGARRDGSGRQGAYLSNVVKCRPPLGRLPQGAELAQCAGYLQREIELVQPKVILAMGRFAVQLVLGDYPQYLTAPLGKQRGRVYRYAGLPVVVTYHPKVLLRAGADKAKAWADLCLAMELVDGAEPCLQSPS